MNTKSLVLPLLLGLGLAGCKKNPETASPASPDAPAASAARPAVQSKAPVTLRLKWPVGARYAQRMDIVQKVETTMAGMAQTMKQDVQMSQDFGLGVLSERSDGGRDVELDFLSMQMTVRVGDRVLLSFDSGGESLDGDKNPMAELFRNMVGARIKFILDASNQVVRLEGLKDFRNRVLTNSPAHARASMGQMLSEDYFKQMINFGQGLPPQPVRPGDTWPVATEIAIGPLGIMQLNLHYVFKGFEQRDKRPCALLEFSGIVKSKPGPEAASPNIKMSIGEGTTAGQSWFDPDVGIVVASEINQDMIMNIEVGLQKPAGSNEPPAPRSMTTKIKQKIILSLKPEARTAPAN